MSVSGHSLAWAVPLVVVGLLSQSAPQRHDKAFWRDILERRAGPPAGESLPALLDELSAYLGSPDPELRDDIGYTVLVRWIYSNKAVPADERRRLLAEWTANLTKGIGEQGTDSIFRRSFSALALGVLAALDNDAPFLDRAEFDRLLAAALTYLEGERDVRGFDPVKGWMHSAAHTADLIKFLARSRHLQPAQQASILGAITDKMTSAGSVFTHGEGERLARAVLSLAARPDLDEAGFKRWATDMAKAAPSGPPTPATLAAGENRKHLLVSLHALLSVDQRDAASMTVSRAIVLAALKGER